MKGSADVEGDGAGRSRSTRICGETLARAPPAPAIRSRSRRTSGRRIRFDKAIADFSERYADQNQRDYADFSEAIRYGRLAATEGV